TGQGGVAGTLAYMSPEVLMGQKPSQSSDLFALGVMLYEILTGVHPFIGENVSDTITAILERDPDWGALDVAIDLLWVIQKLLEKSPEDRYQTATEVMRAISHAIGLPLPIETSDIRESFLQAARFIGREAELSQLVSSLKAIITASQSPYRADTSDPVGARWLIGGESGVGKSRLIEEIRIRAVVQGVIVVRGQAIAEGGMPYQLWRELLRRMVLGVELEEFTLSILKEILPDLPTLLDRQIPDFPNADDPATFQKRLFTAVEEVFKRTLAQTPILFIAEDLQWASESLSLLKEISQLAFDFPLMVVGVYRDDERPNLPSELPTFTHMSLKRLSTEEITRLSQSILGDMGERPQVVDLLERETEGNVFFLVEVVRALAEDAGSLADIGRATLPSQIFSGGIQRIVSHRL
ncbi:MAG TPA: AAA family ATPase, partial [Aggregatilineales bacterium]|nr:AAA family ATPase [Aggregatilineales bacterium]